MAALPNQVVGATSINVGGSFNMKFASRMIPPAGPVSPTLHGPPSAQVAGLTFGAVVVVAGTVGATTDVAGDAVVGVTGDYTPEEGVAPLPSGHDLPREKRRPTATREFERG